LPALMQDVHTVSVFTDLPTRARHFCKLGLKFRFVTAVGCHPLPPLFLAKPCRTIRAPTEAPFPQIWQTVDILLSS